MTGVHAQVFIELNVFVIFDGCAAHGAFHVSEGRVATTSV